MSSVVWDYCNKSSTMFYTKNVCMQDKTFLLIIRTELLKEVLNKTLRNIFMYMTNELIPLWIDTQILHVQQTIYKYVLQIYVCIIADITIIQTSQTIRIHFLYRWVNYLNKHFTHFESIICITNITLKMFNLNYPLKTSLKLYIKNLNDVYS